MKRRLSIYIFGLMLAASAAIAASSPGSQSEPPKAWGDWTRWGDQGDGTYRNPVLPADYSDLDCIRVGGLLGLRLEPVQVQNIGNRDGSIHR